MPEYQDVTINSGVPIGANTAAASATAAVSAIASTKASGIQRSNRSTEIEVTLRRLPMPALSRLTNSPLRPEAARWPLCQGRLDRVSRRYAARAWVRDVAKHRAF